VRAPGSSPRRRISTENDVAAGDWPIFGPVVNAPAPWRRTALPADTSSSSARHSVIRETPSRAAIARSGGSGSPGAMVSSWSSTWSRTWRYFIGRRS
jgi:hypothetical protein